MVAVADRLLLDPKSHPVFSFCPALVAGSYRDLITLDLQSSCNTVKQCNLLKTKLTTEITEATEILMGGIKHSLTLCTL